MIGTAKLSSKSQLTIPAWARAKLGLTPGAKVALRLDGDRLILERIDQDVGELEGALRGMYGDVDAYVNDQREDRSG
jgi:AbrB family looped-hinge helix DNA binding protein